MLIFKNDVAVQERRVFRTFYKFAIPTGTAQVIRAVVPCNIILRQIALNLVRTEILVETVVGGTPFGSFDTALSTFNVNNTNFDPVPVSLVQLATGGGHSGGTVLDQLWGKSGNNSNNSVSVGAAENDYRGVSPATYYFRLVNTDGAQADGIFKATWEELLI